MTDTFIGVPDEGVALGGERTSSAANETPAADGGEGCGACEDEMTDTLLEEG